MKAMHLDTIWMPSDINTLVTCDVEEDGQMAEIDRRMAFEVTVDPTTQELKVFGLGTMREHMVQRNTKIISLSDNEQKAFAPNFLNLGNDIIILSKVDENSVNKKTGAKTIEEKLQAEGKIVLNADLQAITKGYGGLHCMTAAIKRG